MVYLTPAEQIEMFYRFHGDTIENSLPHVSKGTVQSVSVRVRVCLCQSYRILDYQETMSLLGNASQIISPLFSLLLPFVSQLDTASYV